MEFRGLGVGFQRFGREIRGLESGVGFSRVWGLGFGVETFGVCPWSWVFTGFGSWVFTGFGVEIFGVCPSGRWGLGFKGSGCGFGGLGFRGWGLGLRFRV